MPISLLPGTRGTPSVGSLGLIPANTKMLYPLPAGRSVLLEHYRSWFTSSRTSHLFFSSGASELYTFVLRIQCNTAGHLHVSPLQQQFGRGGSHITGYKLNLATALRESYSVVWAHQHEVTPPLSLDVLLSPVLYPRRHPLTRKLQLPFVFVSQYSRT